MASDFDFEKLGDHMRCVAQLVEHGHFTTEQAHGYCNLLEKRNTGEYPAQHAKDVREGKKASADPDVVAFKLDELRDRLGKWRRSGGGGGRGPLIPEGLAPLESQRDEIGRASCRERV